MRSVKELLFYLYDSNVKISLENNELILDAPKDFLTKELVDEITSNKSELISTLIELGEHLFSENIPKADRNQDLPISLLQQRLWFLYKLEGKTTTYNIPFFMSIKGKIDFDAMGKAFDEIVKRHEILRTVFRENASGPIQVVLPKADSVFSMVDLQNIEKDRREEEGKMLSYKEYEKPFDLENGPLFKTILYKLDDNSSILFINIHHIVYDGWSFSVLTKEFNALYNAFLKNEPLPLEELKIQYADFSVWQKKRLTGDVLKKQLDYWADHLKYASGLLDIPADRPRPSVQSFKGDIFNFEIAEDLAAKVKKLSKEINASLFATLYCAFAVLIHRYTASKDIVIGTVSANRTHKDIENLIGFFVNTLPFRVDFSDNPSFDELVSKVKKTIIDSYDCQEVPFERIVEEVSPKRSLSYQPIVQVLFVLQSKNDAAFKIENTSIEHFMPQINMSKFDISLEINDLNSKMICIFEYCSDLFNADTISRMAENFKAVLNSIVANPKQKASDIDLISKDEKEKILVKWNDTYEDYPLDTCIHELFEMQVLKTPDAYAASFEDKSITYKQLNDKANRLANYLKSIGVGPEVLIGICIEKSIDMIIGLLAILKAGGAYVPLDPNYPKERIDFIIKDSGVKILITSSKISETLKDSDITTLCLDTIYQKTEFYSNENFKTDTKPDNLSYVIYTSGSTGEPKGVQISHRSLVNLCFWHNDSFAVTHKDKAGMTASFGFDASVWELWPYLISGACICPVKKEIILSPDDLMDWLIKNEITVCFLPTPMAESVLLFNWPKETKLRIMLTGGDKLSVHPVQPLPFKLINNYGPTENTVVATFCDVSEYKGQSAPPIGGPISNTKIYILDKGLKPVPIGVPGELHIAGIGLARGYLNRPEMNKEKFIYNPFKDTDNFDRLYKTGDLCRWLPNGNIEFLGRIDNQVKIRGFRIELAEIENVLLRHPSVKENVVILDETDLGDKQLTAYVVREFKKDESKSKELGELTNILKEYLKKSLPDYMIPSYFVFLDKMPLTPNSKIDKKSLPKPKREKLLDSVMPKSETQKLISSIWQELIGIENIGIYENFFEVGGHSLLAVKVQKKLNETFNKNIAVTDVFQYPTIDSMSQYISGYISKKDAINVKDTGQKEEKDSCIAVIGLAFRFPGARTEEEFWNNLKNGVNSISVFSDEQLIISGAAPEVIKQPNYVKARGIIEDIELFDAPFFNYTPREAEIIDPQHRIFLECAYQALEKAGYPQESDNCTIGVYAGTGHNHYLYNNILNNRQILKNFSPFQLTVGNDKDFAATRVSYKLNLKGPAVSVQTACSTSLTAVHFACRDIIDRRCNIALAGGVSLFIPQKTGYLYQKGMIASPDGVCRAFDAKANGTVSGSGCAILVLKRFKDALEDKDNILAVIKGTAINNDGSIKVGYTAPSIEGQAKVIEDAQSRAKVAPQDITYIEAHGTGTELGDPIEIAALTKAFNTQKRNFCAIGSLKTNIGHLDAAAGAASLIKAILSVKNGFIPPSLNFESPNPKIDFENSPFYVNDKLTNWDASPRIAGVSSFGIGGTNAHVIIEQAPQGIEQVIEQRIETSIKQEAYSLIILSAKTKTALEKTKTNLASFLEKQGTEDLSDTAYTLQTGRKAFDHRCFIVVQTAKEAVEKLTSGADVCSAFYDSNQNKGDNENEPYKDIDFYTKEGLQKLGHFWLAGVDIDWKRFYNKKDRPSIIPLPTYPFESTRYWIEPPKKKEAALLKRSDISDWFYLPVWKKQPLTAPKTDQKISGSILMFIDKDSISFRLSEKLKEMGHKIITVEQGKEFNKIDENSYILDPASAGDYNLLLNNINSIDIKTAIHCWTASDYGQFSIDKRVENAITHGFYSLMFFIRALGKSYITQQKEGDFNINIVSSQLYKTYDEPLLYPEKAVLLGILKTVGQQYNNIKCKNIDIEENKPQDQNEIIENLIAEIFAKDTETIAAYRGQQRWIQSFEQIKLEKPDISYPATLKKGGVYLITGGLGNIGLIIAEYLAETVKANIIITGRSKFPDKNSWEDILKDKEQNIRTAQKIEKLLEIEKLGSKVMLFEADVSDLKQMEEVITKSNQHFGKIDGVFHCAGDMDTSTFKPLSETNKADCMRQFTPKIYGTLTLNQLLNTSEADFCLLMSSLSSILGGVNFSSYSAANAFLDAFALSKDKAGCKWLSVIWDGWKNEDDKQKAAPTEISRLSITKQEGKNALAAILNTDKSAQIIVSSADLNPRIDKWLKTDFSAEPEHETYIKAPKTLHPRPDLQKPYLAPISEIQKTIANIWQDTIGIDKIGIHDNYFELGGDSLLAVSIQNRLKEAFKKEFSAVDLFQYPTIYELAKYISGEKDEEFKPTKEAYIHKSDSDKDIAVIGMAFRFPGAKTQEQLWENLKNGVESIKFFSDQQLIEEGAAPKLIENPDYVKAGSFIEDIEMLDSHFFNIPPKEAEIMDPQHRIFLECAYQALENAGCASQSDKYCIGVYGGAGFDTYLKNNIYGNYERLKGYDPFQTAIGSDRSYLTTRVSYKLDLNGPSLNVQSSCSTSLVAVHIACRDLIEKQCNVALAGGATIYIPQKTGYLYKKGGLNSPDGRCRAFDADSNGTIFGSGCGIVVLKRLKDAVSDKNNIMAVIKGTAINNDGRRKAGYTAPSVEGQYKVIAQAHANAQIDPETITYIEAHGTGTKLGDPIEIKALTKAFNSAKKQFCAIGSVKTNFGHLDTASGVAGLIKAVLSIKNGFIPPSLHFKKPNPEIDFENTPFYVNNKLTKWEAIPKRAGVSSFGVGGTNAHIIIEQPPNISDIVKQRACHLLIMSAKTETALEKIKKNLADYLKQNISADLSKLAYTLQVGRNLFDYRSFIVCKDVEEAIEKLETGKDVYTKFFDSGKNIERQEVNTKMDFNTEAGLLEIGGSWLDGNQINWDRYYKDSEKPGLIPIPSYPFERQPYWIEPQKHAKKDTEETAKEEPANRHLRPALSEPFEEPKTKTEKNLAQIWGQILGIDGIGRNDNFFELGGDSMIGARVITEMQEEFEADFSVALLFDMSTIADLADYIETELRENIEL